MSASYLTRNIYTYRLRSFLTACRKEIVCFLTPCRKEARYSFLLPLTGPCRLEGTALRERLAASRNRKHSWRMFNAT